MRLLIFNIGSSSLKFNLYNISTGEKEMRGAYDRFSPEGAELSLSINQKPSEKIQSKATTVLESFSEIPQLMKKHGIADPDAISHRVAHGGTFFRQPAIITDKVIDTIKACTPLAPLHNPPALSGIEFAQKQWPKLPQVAVFDTAFHQSIPQRSHTYAVPQEWREAGLRRYGFHGSSHKYIAYRTAEVLGIKLLNLRIISCHLGNGASVCAIERGKSVDTSMGMTALEGLVMGTRSGDLDPGAIEYLQNSLGLTTEQISDGLYKHSGMKGLTNGFSSDLRDIEQEAAKGNPACQLAINVYAYRVRKYIGAYAAAMGGVDVLAFTGGIGENSISMRRRICDHLGFLGIQIDEVANENVNIKNGKVSQIQVGNAMVRVMVMQSREQWMIAQESSELLKQEKLITTATTNDIKIPVAVSARHCHMDRRMVDLLFGRNYELTPFKNLKQIGHWASKETVDIVGPKGELKNMRILGPLRSRTQIEVSKTDTFVLGVEAPVRASGHLEDTPFINIRGPLGEVETDGLIIAERHIHMNTEDAKKLDLEDGDYIDVRLNPEIEFRNVLVRVDESFTTEMHIDTDEANASRLMDGTLAEITGGVNNSPTAEAETKGKVEITSRRTREKTKIRPIRRKKK